MGVIAHKALIITGVESMAVGTECDQMTNAYNKAKELFSKDDEDNKVDMVSQMIGTGMNQYKTFIVVLDGSKEGWAMSDYFDKKIDEMVDYLKSDKCVFEDKSSFLDWVLVEYGETGRRILKSNCNNRY